MELKGFHWTKRSERAAQLLAEDELSDAEIAGEVGMTRAGLAKWKTHPEFRERVRGLVEGMAEAIRAKGIADRRNRVSAANERWNRLHQVIAARAGDPRMADVPGGTTGLLVAEPVLIKVFEQASEGDGLAPTKVTALVSKYAVDTATLAELRAHEMQVAKELGQWTEKRELTGKGGGPIEVAERPDLSKLSDAELDELAGLVAKTGKAAATPTRRGTREARKDAKHTKGNDGTERGGVTA